MKKSPKRAKVAGAARDGSKAAKVLDLLKRPDGATMKELMKATGWQTHSVRGFLSGTIGKKMGLTVKSAKAEDGERTYSVKASQILTVPLSLSTACHDTHPVGWASQPLAPSTKSTTGTMVRSSVCSHRFSSDQCVMSLAACSGPEAEHSRLG